MAEDKRPLDASARSRRKRVFETGCHVLTLLVGSGYLLFFTTALQTGYLSWVGVVLGCLLVVLLVISPIVGLAGCRRLNTVLTFCGFGLPILILLVLELLLWRAEGNSKGGWKPYRFDDTLAAIEAERAVPDAQNAARRYDEAFASADMDDEPNFIFCGSSLQDEIGERPWTRDDHPRASEWLDSQSRLIEELLATGRMGKCRWPVQADRCDAYTVPYRGLSRSVLLLVAAGNRDLGEGRTEEALSKYLCILAIADHRHQQPSEIDFFVAFSYERVSMERFRLMLVQGDLSDDLVDRIAARLPSVADPWPQEWAKLRQFEKLQYMNFLGRLYEMNGAGRVRFARRFVFSPGDGRDVIDISSVPRVTWLLSMPRDPRKVTGLAEAYFARVDREMSLPQPAESDDHDTAGSLTLRDFAKAKCNSFRWVVEAWDFNAAKYARHRGSCVAAVAARRGTWLVLGLRRYRNAHGSWPATLNEVSPYVPAEAFRDPTSGGTFVYAREGDGFRLHSKGPDPVEGRGQDGYLALWPPRVREPVPEPNSQEVLKMLEQIYGKEAAKTMLRNDSNERR
ncbi:MAG: hypothetical protein GX448_21170 [Planctomycetes bacterium]|nr:hypothetical protein [Planctomycetota bacterium]